MRLFTRPGTKGTTREDAQHKTVFKRSRQNSHWQELPGPVGDILHVECIKGTEIVGNHP